MSVGSRARRSRLGQLLALALVVGAVVACAGFTALATQTLQRGLLWSRVDELGPLGRQVTLEMSMWHPGTSRALPDRLRAAIDPRVRDVTTGEVVTYFRGGAPVDIPSTKVGLVSSSGQCEHVRFVAGGCPSGTGDVAVAEQVASTYKLAVGRPIPSHGSVPLHLVGVYADPSADPYWAGLSVGKVTTTASQGNVEDVQVWLVAEPTMYAIAQTFPVGIQLTRSIDGKRLTPARLPAAIDGIKATQVRGSALGVDARLSENVTAVDSLVRADLDQIGVIVPLLTGQLALLLLVMLWLVTRATVELRRPELALARIRGLSRAGGRRLVVGELWPAYLLGLVGGLAAAYAADAVLRHLWLPGGLGAEWSTTALLLAVGATVVCALALLLAVALLLRSRVLDLLRTVPVRRSGVRLGALEIVAVALGLAGVVAVATGNLSGTVALLTPFFAALVLGIVASALLAPLAGRLVARRFARGSLAGGLVLTQLARRPAARQVLLALVVATALVTFAAGTVAAGAENRAARADVDTGARSVLRVAAIANPVGVPELVKAVDATDPRHEHLTPVVLVSSPGSGAPTTMAVVPADMPRFSALKEVDGRPIPWDRASGQGRALVQRWTSPSGGSFQAPLLQELDGTYTAAGSVGYLPLGLAHQFATDLRAQLPSATRQSDLDLQVWSDSASPSVFEPVKKALRDAGFETFDVATTAERRAVLDASAPAWGLQLGLVVGAGSALVALLVLLTVLATTARSRSADARALRTGGVPVRVLRRALVTEQLVLVAVGAGLGVVAGLVGSLLSFERVPWFSTPPDYPLQLAGIPWAVVGPTVAALLAVLVLAAWAAGAWLARTSTGTR